MDVTRNKLRLRDVKSLSEPMLLSNFNDLGFVRNFSFYLFTGYEISNLNIFNNFYRVYLKQNN